MRRDTDKLFKMIGEAYAILSDPAKVKKKKTSELSSDLIFSSLV